MKKAFLFGALASAAATFVGFACLGAAYSGSGCGGAILLFPGMWLADLFPFEGLWLVMIFVGNTVAYAAIFAVFRRLLRIGAPARDN